MIKRKKLLILVIIPIVILLLIIRIYQYINASMVDVRNYASMSSLNFTRFYS